MTKNAHDFGQSDEKVTIYGNTDKLKTFMPEATPRPIAQGEPLSSGVAGFSRQAYPGAPSVSVAGHNRRRAVGAGENFAVMPGEFFWFEKKGLDGKWRSYQFSYTGAFIDLRTQFQSEGAVGTALRGPRGRRFLKGAN
jgi:hypothetical protein